MTARPVRLDAARLPTMRATLDALVGRTTPGGCLECDADQRVTHEGGGVYRLVIVHEDGCPMLRRAQR